MSGPDHTETRREVWPGSLQEPTLCAAFQRTVRERADHLALRTHGGSCEYTFAEYGQHVRDLAGGLAGLGVGRGDTVACMMVNRPEFHLCDTAALHLGAASFSLYNTSAPEQIAHVLRDAAPRVVFTEPQFLPRVRAVIDRAGLAIEVVLVEGRAPHVHELEGLEAPAGFDFDRCWQEVEPGDLLTLIYTSGTTGPPKGVELSHANMLAQARALEAHFGLPMGGRSISFLPAAHVADRALSHYANMTRGLALTCCSEPTQVFAAAVEFSPTVFGGVPRVWEKLAAALEPQIGRRPRLDERAARALRERLGLGEVEAFIVGAAPTPTELFEFFGALGIELLESWGMSELSCVATIARPGSARPGAVGVPLPGLKLRLADDGEVLVKGPTVMRGYRNLPGLTAESIDADGWMHTGDIGTFDPDGQMRIVDRKKEMIVNAAGKNMSPANIEAILRGASGLIDQVMVVGDRRPYNVALITLDPDALAVWAERRGISTARLAELAEHPDVVTEIDDGVERANQSLARVEQVKRFRLIGSPWEPAGDELTPTLKLKRRSIEAKYGSEIEQLYAVNRHQAPMLDGK